MKTNVVFEYAGENMETVHDKVAVTGEITECGFAVMMAATNRDGAFVPATVGLRKVNYAKLVGVEPCEADSVAVCSADVLVGRFVNASGAWDELSSNRQVQSGAVRVGIPFVYGLYNFTPVRNGANKKISWWISREGIGHALYCFTANYTPEIGYQFQHISNYISMFEEQFGTPEGKPKFKKTLLVDAMWQLSALRSIPMSDRPISLRSLLMKLAVSTSGRESIWRTGPVLN